MKTSHILLSALIVLLLGSGIYYFTRKPQMSDFVSEKTSVATSTNEGGSLPSGTIPMQVQQEDTTRTVLGKSVEGRNIVGYHFGTGEKELLFVGGIHGGYEWNTTLVAYNLMQYLEQHPEEIPSGVKVTIVPVLNPDGLNKVVGTTDTFSKSDVTASPDEQTVGRFNSNNVDLNRNFDCDWQESGVWQTKKVSGGTSVFSEPESQAMKSYITSHPITASIVWFSAEGGVYSSNCHSGVSEETSALTALYAKASGYPPHEDFNFYDITGDMTNWLAKNNIPAISVLLTTHQDVEWEKNLAGIKAVLAHYGK